MRFDDPVLLFHEAQAALLARDAQRFGDCFDPVSLGQYRRQTIETLRHPHPAPTVEDFLRQSPDMPREVAEYHIAQANQQTDRLKRLREDFPGADSVEDVERLSPAEFFFAHTEAMSLGNQIRRMVAQGQLPPEAGVQIPELEQVAIGWVRDGDHVAHVLHRDRIDEGNPGMEQWLAELPEDERDLVRKTAGRSHPRSAACVRQPDGGWKLMAEYGTFGRSGMAIGYARAEPAAE
jgi:hypothetical protein